MSFRFRLSALLLVLSLELLWVSNVLAEPLLNAKIGDVSLTLHTTDEACRLPHLVRGLPHRAVLIERGEAQEACFAAGGWTAQGPTFVVVFTADRRVMTADTDLFVPVVGM